MSDDKWNKTYEEMSEWILFAEQYLNSAQLACREILEPKHKPRYIFGDFFPVHKGRHTNAEIQRFYFPIIYNFKHGLELAIKYFQCRLQISPERTHNIRYLFEELRRCINGKKAKRLLQDMRESDPEIFGSDFFNPTNIEKQMADLEDIVMRYYRVDYICPDAIQIIEDYKNTAFRYPSNDLAVKIDYFKHLERVSDTNINMLYNDIKKAISAVEMLTYMIQP